MLRNQTCCVSKHVDHIHTWKLLRSAFATWHYLDIHLLDRRKNEHIYSINYGFSLVCNVSSVELHLYSLSSYILIVRKENRFVEKAYKYCLSTLFCVTEVVNGKLEVIICQLSKPLLRLTLTVMHHLPSYELPSFKLPLSITILQEL